MIKTNVYEGLFILNSDAYARNPEEVSSAVAKTIESLGGTVRVSRLWEERKLAYPIDGHRRGAYWLAYFRLSTDQAVELNRQFSLNNNIVRFLITRLDPRLEEALIQHALAPAASAEEAAAPAEAPADVYDNDGEEE